MYYQKNVSEYISLYNLQHGPSQDFLKQDFLSVFCDRKPWTIKHILTSVVHLYMPTAPSSGPNNYKEFKVKLKTGLFVTISKYEYSLLLSSETLQKTTCAAAKH